MLGEMRVAAILALKITKENKSAVNYLAVRTSVSAVSNNTE